MRLCHNGELKHFTEEFRSLGVIPIPQTAAKQFNQMIGEDHAVKSLEWRNSNVFNK
jgi:hypothetical protein